MYKNKISFFSFPFIAQNVLIDRVQENRRWLSYTHNGWGNLLFSVFSGWVEIFLVIYNIPEIHTNSHGHTSFSLPLTQCLWTCFLLAYHPRKFWWSHLLRPATYTMHVDVLPFSMPPTQITWHFCQEHLGPVYFRYQVHFLLFSFNQGPTSAATSTEVKEVFKSISSRRS